MESRSELYPEGQEMGETLPDTDIQKRFGKTGFGNERGVTGAGRHVKVVCSEIFYVLLPG